MYTLLIVDDMPIVVDSLAEDIRWKEVNIHKVFKAYNAEDALDILEKEKISVMITDIKMPGRNGLELIQSIINKYEKLKVILYSAYGEFEYAQRAMEYGVSYFLTKPTAYSEILEKVGLCIKKILQENQNLLHANKAGTTEVGEKSGGKNSLVRHAKKIIGNNLGRSIKLEEIANELYVHPNHLSRIFKVVEGVTIFDYIISQKILYAIEMLKEPGVKVADIAELLGYESVSYFSRIFKRETGYSPKEYKDMYL